MTFTDTNNQVSVINYQLSPLAIMAVSLRGFDQPNDAASCDRLGVYRRLPLGLDYYYPCNKLIITYPYATAAGILFVRLRLSHS